MEQLSLYWRTVQRLEVITQGERRIRSAYITPRIVTQVKMRMTRWKAQELADGWKVELVDIVLMVYG